SSIALLVFQAMSSFLRPHRLEAVSDMSPVQNVRNVTGPYRFGFKRLAHEWRAKWLIPNDLSADSSQQRS
ncbi:MAG: hypothetical protein ABSF23_11235, partial [Terracidiphilus sp.]